MLSRPVTAAAVILPESFNLPFLNDSKKLNEKQRKQLRLLIQEQALDYTYAHVTPENEIK